MESEVQILRYLFASTNRERELSCFFPSYTKRGWGTAMGYKGSSVSCREISPEAKFPLILDYLKSFHDSGMDNTCVYMD